MANPLDLKPIKYLNRDESGLKRDLIKYSQAHHSGVFQDFNESSPGMAILELQAYIGGVLSFYQDRLFDELRQDTARQIENVSAFAKMKGYKPSGLRAASGIETFFVEVPATVGADGSQIPDPLYTPILRKGASIGGPNGVLFETLEDIVFSASVPTDGTERLQQVTGSQFDANGVPTYFALRKDAPIVAGTTVTDSFTLNDFQSFLQLELSQPNVIEVISVTDSDGNTWYEVDYLAQETVFDFSPNTDFDNDTVPYVLTLKSVPRRFITDYDPKTTKTSLIFGSGDGVSFDDQLIPNLADLALPLPGRRTFNSFSVDPQNFLKTRSLGLSPYSTTLTVNYRVGGGDKTNVPPGTIKSPNKIQLDFSTTGLNPSKIAAVIGSVECINVDKTDGGGPAETIAEIKANSAAFFAAQNRLVTKEDYISRILTLPQKFGTPAKVYVKKSPSSQLSLDVHILSIDSNGHLTQATPTLQKNVKTYLDKFRMITDGINILQSDIINVGVQFGIVVSSKRSKSEVLTNCLSELVSYFDLSNMQIGAPIVRSDVIATLQSVDGVISVYKLDLINKFRTDSEGFSYSSISYPISSPPEDGIYYCPDNSIFEVKYLNRDIVGEAK